MKFQLLAICAAIVAYATPAFSAEKAKYAFAPDGDSRFTEATNPQRSIGCYSLPPEKAKELRSKYNNLRQAHRLPAVSSNIDNVVQTTQSTPEGKGHDCEGGCEAYPSHAAWVSAKANPYNDDSYASSDPSQNAITILAPDFQSMANAKNLSIHVEATYLPGKERGAPLLKSNDGVVYTSNLRGEEGKTFRAVYDYQTGYLEVTEQRDKAAESWFSQVNAVLTGRSDEPVSHIYRCPAKPWGEGTVAVDKNYRDVPVLEAEAPKQPPHPAFIDGAAGSRKMPRSNSSSYVEESEDSSRGESREQDTAQ